MLKDNLKQFLTYAVGSVSQTALGFVLLPLYLSKLTTSEYGVLQSLLTLNSVVSIVAGAGVLSALSRLYYDQDRAQQRGMAGTVILWTASTTLALSLLLAALAPVVASVMFSGSNAVADVRVAAVLLFVSAIQASLYIILRLEKRATTFVVITVGGFMVDLSLKIVMIGVEHWGVEGYFISSVISTTLTIAAASFMVRHDVVLAWGRGFLRELLALGLPFIFTGVSMWVLDVSDRMILLGFTGTSVVGVYALAGKFASIMNIVLLGPLSLFWVPFIFSYRAEHGDAAMRRVSRHALTAFALAGCLLLVCIGAGSADVLRLLPHKPAYQQATILIPFLALAPLLYMLSYPAGSAILHSKKVRYSSYAMLISAIVNLGLNLILVPRFSLYGATATTVIGYIVLCGLQYYWAQRVFPVDYDWWRGARILLSAGAGLLAAFVIRIHPAWLSLIVRESAALLCFGLLAWLLGGIRKSDLDLMYQRIRVARTQPPVPNPDPDQRESLSTNTHVGLGRQ